MNLRRNLRICKFNANKNTWGVKKCEGDQKQHANRQVQPIALISAEAKKLSKMLLTP